MPDTVTTCPLAYFLFIPVCGSIYLFVCAYLVPADAVSGCVVVSTMVPCFSSGSVENFQ